RAKVNIMQRGFRYLTILVAALYLAWIGANVAHARSVVAGENEKHSCKNMGNVAHHCRHVSADGKVHKDKAHDGNGHIDNAVVWGAMLRQARYAAVFGFFQEGDDASVPPECTCPVSCFLGGNGL